MIFHGVDTFANVSLNDHVVGETSNMFLKYTFDVTDYITVSKLKQKIHVYIDNYIHSEYAGRAKSIESHVSFGR